MGRLGLHRMFDINRAMAAKLGWQVYSDQDCLWVKAVKATFLNNKQFMEAQEAQDSTWVWKGIMKYCDPRIPSLSNFRPGQKQNAILPRETNLVHADLIVQERN